MAEKTLWSHMTGLRAYVSVLPGVLPAVPSATLYQPVVGIARTEVVFEMMSPYTVVVPGTTISCCSPCTEEELAVKGVPVAVALLAVAAVNGEPVVAEST